MENISIILDKLILFVEEISMKTALDYILPKISTNLKFNIINFQCKSDLLKNISHTLLDYSNFMTEKYLIMILVDRDKDDCLKLKNILNDLTNLAKKNAKKMESI
jgi:hypothetical protein